MKTKLHKTLIYGAMAITGCFILSVCYGEIESNPDGYRMIYKGSGLNGYSILVLGYGMLESEGVKVKRGEVILQVSDQEQSSCDTVRLDLTDDMILSETFIQERRSQSMCMYEFSDPRIEIVKWDGQLTYFDLAPLSRTLG